MAATALTLGVPTHDTLATTLTAYSLPRGTKQVYMYAATAITFEIQQGGADPDGSAAAADAYYTLPAGGPRAIQLSDETYTNLLEGKTVYLSAAGNGVVLEIAAWSEGL